MAPLYAMMEGFDNGPIVLYKTNAGQDLFARAAALGTLFFIGLLIGFKIQSKNNVNEFKEEPLTQNIIWRRIFIWGIVSAISSYFFLKPFFDGGFNILNAGGYILDIDRNSYHAGVLGLIESTFFSYIMVPVSTTCLVYYLLKLNIKNSTKWVVSAILIFVQVIIAYTTTRRAYALSIIVCVILLYIKNYYKRNNSIPKSIIIVGVIIVSFFYLQDILWRQTTEVNNLAESVLLFDGIPPYDALLNALQEKDIPVLFSNVIYGVFRPIPVLGKYIVEFFGIDPSAPPLYLWLASRYSTYDTGGGIACLPELESYLIGGYFFTLISGIIFGLFFGKKRTGLMEYIMLIMSFSVARGSLQIFFSLYWQCVIMGYLVFEKLIGGGAYDK